MIICFILSIQKDIKLYGCKFPIQFWKDSVNI